MMKGDLTSISCCRVVGLHGHLGTWRMQAAVRNTETQVVANVHTIHIEQPMFDDVRKLRKGAFTKKSAQEGVTRRLYPHGKRANIPTAAAAQR